MQIGWVISLGIHAVMLAAVLFMVPYNDARDRDLQTVTEVSIIVDPGPAEETTAPEPEVAEEAPPEVAPEVNEIALAEIAPPSFDAEAGPPPEADAAPVATEQDIIEDPSARDTEADLSAVRTRVVEPDRVERVDAPDTASTEQSAPDMALPQMALPGTAGLDSRSETPRGPQISRPPSPQSAPTISSFTPPPPPKKREEEPAEEEVVEEPQPEEAEPTEVETETVEPAPDTAPAPAVDEESGAEEGLALRRAPPPRRRPENLEAELEAAAAAQAEAEAEAAARAEAEAEATAAAVAAAAEEALATSDPLAAPPQSSEGASDVPEGPPLTAGEKDALRLAVSRCWNPPTLVANASDLRVVVALELDAKGRIVGTPRLIEPTRADRPEIRAAYEAARRALLRCGGGGYDLPPEKYAQWKNLEVAFDPAGMLARW